MPLYSPRHDEVAQRSAWLHQLFVFYCAECNSSQGFEAWLESMFTACLLERISLAIDHRLQYPVSQQSSVDPENHPESRHSTAYGHIPSHQTAEAHEMDTMARAVQNPVPAEQMYHHHDELPRAPGPSDALQEDFDLDLLFNSVSINDVDTRAPTDRDWLMEAAPFAGCPNEQFFNTSTFQPAGIFEGSAAQSASRGGVTSADRTFDVTIAQTSAGPSADSQSTSTADTSMAVQPAEPFPASKSFRDLPKTRASDPRWTGPFVPQTMYKVCSKTRAKCEERGIDLCETVLFERGLSCGISLGPSFKEELAQLTRAAQPVLESCGPSVSIRIEWPGYVSFSCQIAARDWCKERKPITLAKFATEIYKVVGKFFKKNHNIAMDIDADAIWSLRRFTIGDLVLVSVHHVSQGSWQPHIRLCKPVHTYAQTSEG